MAPSNGQGQESFADYVENRLFNSMPHFAHYMWLENATKHGLPQNRARVFFIGVNNCCMDVYDQQLQAPAATAVAPADDPAPALRLQACRSLRLGGALPPVQGHVITERPAAGCAFCWHARCRGIQSRACGHSRRPLLPQDLRIVAFQERRSRRPIATFH